MRSIDSIQHLHELHLSPALLCKYGSFISAQELITAARHGTLTDISGIGSKRATEIAAAVDQQGFIFHESEQSQAIRELLHDTVLFYDPRSLNDKEYEARQPFTPEQIQAVLDIMATRLTPRENKALILLNGLDGNPKRKTTELAEELGISYQRLRQVYHKARRKLRHRKDPAFAQLKTILCENNSYLAEYFANIPLHKLPIRVSVYQILMAAGINSVKELIAHSYSELVNEYGLDTLLVCDIEAALRQLDLSLRRS